MQCPGSSKSDHDQKGSNKKHMARRRQFVFGGGEPADEPKSQTGTLSNAADCLRLLRSLRQRPQFGTSSAVGAVLRVGIFMIRCRSAATAQYLQTPKFQAIDKDRVRRVERTAAATFLPAIMGEMKEAAN
jgi:hypothetical protein